MVLWINNVLNAKSQNLFLNTTNIQLWLMDILTNVKNVPKKIQKQVRYLEHVQHATKASWLWLQRSRGEEAIVVRENATTKGSVEYSMRSLVKRKHMTQSTNGYTSIGVKPTSASYAKSRTPKLTIGPIKAVNISRILKIGGNYVFDAITHTIISLRKFGVREELMEPIELSIKEMS